MTVAELIAELQKMPQTASVGCVWDGAIRSDVVNVWLARRGVVALSDSGAVVYYEGDRPGCAPTAAQTSYWMGGTANECLLNRGLFVVEDSS